MSFMLGRSISNIARKLIVTISEAGYLLVSDAPFVPLGTHTQVANLASVVTLTPPSRARNIIVQVFGANVRYTIDSDTTTNPTASKGFVITAGTDPVVIPIRSAIRFIQESAGASLEYQWGV
jgi:hypothetical protein